VFAVTSELHFSTMLPSMVHFKILNIFEFTASPEQQSLNVK